MALRMWLVGICLLALFAPVSIQRAAVAAAPLSPGATVASFYVWYLHDMEASRDPFNDDRAKLASYVSKTLLKEIERKLNSSDGLDADYVVQAQDYLDDWVDHVSAGKPDVSAHKAVLTVTLGAAKDSIRHLRLTLVREYGAWKIRTVRLLQAAGDR